MVRQWIRCGLLLLLGLFIIVCACILLFYFDTTQTMKSKLPEVVSKAPNRLIKHAMGETWIPMHPQRVIILHWYLWEDAIVLGVKPIGAPVQMVSIAPHINPEQQQGVVDIGFLPTNIEKVLALKPDLILGLDIIHKDIYPLLSHIAPTVIVQYKGDLEWKYHFMQVAQVLDKVESAQKVLADYYFRLKYFRNSMGALLSQIRLSVIGYENQLCWLFVKQKNSFSYGILSKAGLIHRVPQNRDTRTIQRLIPQPGNYIISWEYLQEIDGDVIFVTTFAWRKQEQYQKELKRMQAIPLWFQLKAVQQGKVYQVGSYWIGGGPIAANLVLDDLFKYLSN